MSRSALRTVSREIDYFAHVIQSAHACSLEQKKWQSCRAASPEPTPQLRGHRPEPRRHRGAVGNDTRGSSEVENAFSSLLMTRRKLRRDPGTCLPCRPGRLADVVPGISSVVCHARWPWTSAGSPRPVRSIGRSRCWCTRDPDRGARLQGCDRRTEPHQAHKRMARLHEISQGVGVQRGQEGLGRLAQSAAQDAAPLDPAIAGRALQTSEDAQLLFHVANDSTDLWPGT